MNRRQYNLNSILNKKNNMDKNEFNKQKFSILSIHQNRKEKS